MSQGEAPVASNPHMSPIDSNLKFHKTCEYKSANNAHLGNKQGDNTSGTDCSILCPRQLWWQCLGWVRTIVTLFASLRAEYRVAFGSCNGLARSGRGRRRTGRNSVRSRWGIGRLWGSCRLGCSFRRGQRRMKRSLEKSRSALARRRRSAPVREAVPHSTFWENMRLIKKEMLRAQNWV